MNDEPLIYTAKGNLPLASIRENVVWVDNEQETTCVVEHWLGEECVKRAIHIYYRKGQVASCLGGLNG